MRAERCLHGTPLKVRSERESLHAAIGLRSALALMHDWHHGSPYRQMVGLNGLLVPQVKEQGNWKIRQEAQPITCDSDLRRTVRVR
jgi:hypothetical protein